MIAPEPFFEPRGTPFSEFHRIRALTTLGHTVDLVTYPFGRDVTLPGLRIFRSVRPPGMSRVRVGPSWAKVPLDFFLGCTALRLALTRRYDAIHSHEEGGAIGVMLAWLRRRPHLYDMHSSLPQQVSNFGYGSRTWLALTLGWIERFMIRGSRAVIVICPELETTVRGLNATVPTFLIENAPGSGAAPEQGTGRRIRRGLQLPDDRPIIMYTGTFEAYQGLDLLFDAMVRVAAANQSAMLMMVGGEPAQVEAARAKVDALGIRDAVVFVGQRPAEEVPAYLDAADVLVSPRSTGTNTPLKIYQYLRAGRAIVATRLRTHTQVLSDDTAMLTAPTPDALAAGLLAVLDDRTRAETLARNARHLADTKYTDDAFIEKTRQACEALIVKRDAPVAGNVSARSRLL
jgi:glycosyltransferase involved in cell wall biosynthesis